MTSHVPQHPVCLGQHTTLVCKIKIVDIEYLKNPKTNKSNSSWTLCKNTCSILGIQILIVCFYVINLKFLPFFPNGNLNHLRLIDVKFKTSVKFFNDLEAMKCKYILTLMLA